MTENDLDIKAAAGVVWDRVDCSGGSDACWPSSYTKSKRGYGVAAFRGHSIAAHRLAWIATNGPIGAGLCVLHRCDNPPCCNPEHLFLGTRRDNSHDAIRKGRNAFGERNGIAKLRAKDVVEIRADIARGLTLVEIAAKFGVTPQNIGAIKRGRSWKSVE